MKLPYADEDSAAFDIPFWVVRITVEHAVWLDEPCWECSATARPELHIPGDWAEPPHVIVGSGATPQEAIVNALTIGNGQEWMIDPAGGA